MKLSRNWLKRYVDLSGISDKEIFLRLTMTTAEFEEYSVIGEHFKNIYIGEVKSKKAHPNADKLKIVKVEIGPREYEIVCGAANVDVGQKVPVALDGTALPNNLIIKKAKIRGENSEGMICSKAELALEEKSDGIWVLDNNSSVVPGQTLFEALSLSPDTVFEIDNKSITHRPDLWNHLGFARELSAIFKRELNSPKPPRLDLDKNPEINIEIEDKDDCPRYSGLIIEGIRVEPSPSWLKTHLESVGARSINNIVDITNFVMLELGEPLHAFDKDKLSGNRIFIRRAKDKESLTTLDSVKRELNPGDLVIADSSGPIALAGVMGGENTEVANDTTSIFLEAANFFPGRIRKTASTLDLRSDASLRFEKSLDPELTQEAIFRTWELIHEIYPKAVCRNFVDEYPKQPEKKSIELNHEFLEKRLGIKISPEEITDILNKLCLVTKEKAGNYTIEIPTYRATKDIAIAEDIVEEIGRVIGYDKIEPIPPAVPVEPTPQLDFRRLEHEIRKIMTGACHADEVFLYSFYGPKLLENMNIPEGRELKLQNWLSDEMDRLRIDLLPGMVKAASLNQRHFNRFRMFEIGRVYQPHKDYYKGVVDKSRRLPLELARESTHLAYLGIEEDHIDMPFYTGKETLQNLLSGLGLTRVEFKKPENPDSIAPYFHPGRFAHIIVHLHEKKLKIGSLGELHPLVMENFDLKKRAAMFSISVNELYELTSTKKRSFLSPFKFPPAFFEITALAGEREEVGNLISVLEKADLALLRKTELLAVFQGENLPEGMKSVSLGLTFQKKDGTISSEELKQIRALVVSKLDKAGYPLKS